MPTYQYTCTSCGEPLEVVQSFTDDALTVCPNCGGELRKVYSAVGVVFKGSGFYRNDSRDKKSKVSSSTSSSDSSSSISSDSGSAKSTSDSSSSSTPAATPASTPAASTPAKSTSTGSAA